MLTKQLAITDFCTLKKKKKFAYALINVFVVDVCLAKTRIKKKKHLRETVVEKTHPFL